MAPRDNSMPPVEIDMNDENLEGQQYEPDPIDHMFSDFLKSLNVEMRRKVQLMTVQFILEMSPELSEQLADLLKLLEEEVKRFATGQQTNDQSGSVVDN